MVAPRKSASSYSLVTAASLAPFPSAVTGMQSSVAIASVHARL